MRPSLDDILALARAARRSPHGRQVLFDALIERYGRHFLLYLKKTQAEADRAGTPIFVFLKADDLRAMERRWPQLEGWGAYAMSDVLRAHVTRGLHTRQGGVRPIRGRDEQLLVTVRPRSVP